MNFTKSGNPMVNDKALTKMQTKFSQNQMSDVLDAPLLESQPMTIGGSVNKTFILGTIVLISAFFSYMVPLRMFLPVGTLGAAAVFFYTSFRPQHSPYTAPVFALLEGLFVGTVSAYYGAAYEGIITIALIATLGTLFLMLGIYQSGLIPVTQKFRMGVSMAVGAIMIIYLVSWVGHFVGFSIPYIHEGGPIGIGITVVIIGIAALNLLLDFDNFEKGEQMKAPKYMEWYFAMSLVFTIVWLYVEFLRLISKLQND